MHCDLSKYVNFFKDGLFILREKERVRAQAGEGRRERERDS